VRETHDFVTEADIQFFRPLVRDELPTLPVACMRDSDGAVAGFIGVYETKIEMLFVHPSWRGKGIGRRLLRYAVESLNATMLDVNEQNEQALGFYLRMGFVVEGRSERDGLGKPYPLLHMRLADITE
jgi:putative acetyltransferase